MEKYAIGLIFDKNEQFEKLNEFLKQYDIDYTNNYFHITLAGFETSDENYLIDKVKQFANSHSEFKITFSHMGTFLTDDNVIFLSPYTSNRLIKYYKDIKHSICENKEIILCPYYKAKVWSPHCSVAYKIPSNIYIDIIEKIKGVVEFPFTAKISQIDIYEYSSRKEKIFATKLSKRKFKHIVKK